MATVRDIEDIITRLTSDKAKIREEGIRLLNNYLEGGSCSTFCALLDQQTTKLRPQERPRSASWPYLLGVLSQCIATEISVSKKRGPKPVLAKTLRNFVQHAEDVKRSGKALLLLRTIKAFFNHIWDVIREVPSFQSEYSNMLRQLLSVPEYRVHMRKKVYAGLVLFYINKAKSDLCSTTTKLSTSKEELFRYTLTLHSLLENPPGDFLDDLRKDLTRAFIEIFAHLRDEGKIARKLLASLNSFLMKDGPNLGSSAQEIHAAAQEFMVRSWITTHDRALKDGLFLYARIQLKLRGIVSDSGTAIEQLIDLVVKELDQGSVTAPGSFRNFDGVKDDKVGTITNSQRCLMELAATVLHEACIKVDRGSSAPKRLKKENINFILKDRLIKAKWMWSGAFCLLIRHHALQLPKPIIFDWFEGMSFSLDRILNDGVNAHAYDSPLWTLRGLQELCVLWHLIFAKQENSCQLATISCEGKDCWQMIWNNLLHWLPLFSNIVAMVEDTFKLLGHLISQNILPVYTFPQDLWELRVFSEVPLGSALYFVASFFSGVSCQVVLGDILQLRKKLLKWILMVLFPLDQLGTSRPLTMLFLGAIFSVCVGCVPFSACSRVSSVTISIMSISREIEDWAEPEEHEKAQEEELLGLEHSEEVLAASGVRDPIQQWEETSGTSSSSIILPGSVRDSLLHEMEDCLLEKLSSDIQDNHKMSLSSLFSICTVMSVCIYGAFHVNMHRAKKSHEASQERMLQKLHQAVDKSIGIAENYVKVLEGGLASMTGVSIDPFVAITPQTFLALRNFMSSPLFRGLEYMDGVPIADHLTGTIILLLEKLLVSLARVFEVATKVLQNNEKTNNCFLGSEFASAVELDGMRLKENNGKARIVDEELDTDKDSKPSSLGSQRDGEASSVSGRIYFSSLQWRLNMISMISSFCKMLPTLSCDILVNLLRNEMDPEVHAKILLDLCKAITGSSCIHVPSVINAMNDIVEECNNSESTVYRILFTINILLESLLSTEKHRCRRLEGPVKVKLSEKELNNLASLVRKVMEMGLLGWGTRIKLIDCICNFVLLDPHTAQCLTERLFMMLQDSDYRVRLSLSKRLGVLFQTWDGHEELFEDICCNFGVKLVMATRGKVVTGIEVLEAGIQAEPFIETALVTLGQLAISSEKMEEEVVFMICAAAAINPSHRPLICAILDRLAQQLKYTTRMKYLEQFMRSILTRWIKTQLSLTTLVEMRDIFVAKSEPKSFIQYCCPLLLPALILSANDTDFKWLAMVTSQSVSALVKHHFASIFAACLPLHCGNEETDKEKATSILQGFMLRIAGMSENERDALIKKHMMAIVSSLFLLCSSEKEPQFPFFSKETIVSAVRTVVDGFLEIEQLPSDGGVVDKIHIFRPDRVFMFLLQIHYQIESAVHPRHKHKPLTGLGVIIDVIKRRAAVPSTCRYLFHMILQCLEHEELQDQCCSLMSSLLDIFKSLPVGETSHVLGSQLQLVVSKLVASCVTSDQSRAVGVKEPPGVLLLLHRLTVDADPSLYNYIKELEHFPDLDCFERIRNFHQELCSGHSPSDELIKFVRRTSNLPQQLRLRSLQNLHRKLQSRQIVCRKASLEVEHRGWPCDSDIVSAVWKLVELCEDDDASNMRDLVGDFIARVGVGDPYAVVFHLPDDCNQKVLCRLLGRSSQMNVSINPEMGVCEDLVIAVIKLVQQYLLDGSVQIVDVAARCLRGLLSTEKGQKAFGSLDSDERSYIGVQSKGVDMNLVENMLNEARSKSKDKFIPLEDASLWQTGAKTFEEWICTLCYSLIHYTDDIILCLCQDMVLLKAPLAELVFPHVLGNLAGKRDASMDICKLVSAQIEEHIYVETNETVRSIQVILDAMNELRLCNVVEKAGAAPEPTQRRESLKSARHSSGSGSKSTRALGREKFDLLIQTTQNDCSSSRWQKVYWLQIDYLLAARAAIQCASYFTAILYIEHWCEEHFGGLSLGDPDFSHHEQLPAHVELLMTAITKINEPDGIYGVRSHKLVSQILTYEHEGNWSKALENYDLVLRTKAMNLKAEPSSRQSVQHTHCHYMDQRFHLKDQSPNWKYYKGLMKSLQQTGCSHVLDLYCQGLASQKGFLEQDAEFVELQYEAAWRAGKWDFYCICSDANSAQSGQQGSRQRISFNANLHSCLRCLDEGDAYTFSMKLKQSKQELVSFISHTSRESTQNIYGAIVKLQILDHLSQAWEMRWMTAGNQNTPLSGPFVPSTKQLDWLNADWQYILKQLQLHFNLLEPFVAFRRVLFQILNCKQWVPQQLLQFATIFRKGGRFGQAATAVHELKLICAELENQMEGSTISPLGRLEEAKLLRAQGQHEMAVNLAKYLMQHYDIGDESADVYRLTGKWLAESRSSSSRTILEQYLKRAVELTEVPHTSYQDKWIVRQCRTHFQLAHYTDALYRSYEERLASSEWQAALQLRKRKDKELEALVKRLKSLTKAEKTDCAGKIMELQKQLAMDKEEAKRLQEDKDSFLMLALESYQHCLITGEKYDIRVVFRLVSLWFNLSTNQKVIDAMLEAIKMVQSYKFLPLVYQIASRMGGSRDSQGPHSFQFALTYLVKKMAIDHPYHTIFQLLALANGDRVKDKQRSKSAFVVDLDKKRAAEDLLSDLSSYHGAIIQQMRQMVEIYIKLAELETKKEDTNRKIPLPRDVRSVRHLELVPVITATLPVDRSCQYPHGSFPYFKGLSDNVMVMNGINAPKVIECFGSDGHKYRQLAKSGNDDLRQDAVMEQFFGLVNTLLQDHPATQKRRLNIRTYKVVPFTPSAGVLEWVDGTMPLGEYLLGSTRNGGAHARYRKSDWPFPTCREHMATEKDKRKAFQRVCENFRPVMHFFFLERFSQPADWFEKRLAYTRSVAASSMVGYIVGLGDRHSMNILIDQATAEVVHIDLGVAFEQGLMLKTPERVPFRLTRDIVDGMGVTGIEGVFRRCCEETLSVMRTNKEALLTIIEVFIHDPLYKWALSPLKALQRQKETDEDENSDVESFEDENEGNKDATRALLRVKQKLDGYEEGEMRSLQGQVQQLIQDALDSERLCQMFPGWAAWL